ncbi:hypothetical protein EI94DRAFT_1817065 [Lactarius quietus]|nr:hypothetical protein EI94DRAFT_1817065 [Lactarius quietus]
MTMGVSSTTPAKYCLETVLKLTASNYGDPSGKLWSMYLTESKKEDSQMTKNWTRDTSGLLIFASLFSVVVTGFITESYKKLSPNSGEQTVALLTQLVNNSTGALAAVQNSPPFKAPASIVRVNVLWFLSLILSLSCALLATLMQQWARRYLEYVQRRRAPRKQARIRAYMFEGVENFRLSQVVQAMPLLLHTSVFLFFAGLVEFLLPINRAVAFSALGCVVVFAYVYGIFTLLPSLRPNCPYFTPLSGITYISLQLSAFSLFWITDKIEGILHEFLLGIWESPDRGPTTWRNTLERKVRAHYEGFSHGLRWSAERGAMNAPQSVDKRALHQTLTSLGEHQDFEDFAARMPGFFDSHTSPDATSTILSLMSDETMSEPILGTRLRELLGTCQPGTSLLTEGPRTVRLRVCLMSLWYCARAYNHPGNSRVPLAPYFRVIFASPQVIRWIQSERDLTTRLLGRCFGSLVVQKLTNDITTCNIPMSNAEVSSLSYILGTTGAIRKNLTV